MSLQGAHILRGQDGGECDDGVTTLAIHVSILTKTCPLGTLCM